VTTLAYTSCVHPVCVCACVCVCVCVWEKERGWCVRVLLWQLRWSVVEGV